MEKPFEETHRDSNPDPPESLYLTVVVCFTCKSNWSIKPHIRIPMVNATKINASTPDRKFSFLILGTGHGTQFRSNLWATTDQREVKSLSGFIVHVYFLLCSFYILCLGQANKYSRARI